MKTEQEIREKLDRVLGIDATHGPLIFSKVAAAKALLWCLGEDDDDSLYIPAKPGRPTLKQSETTHA